MFDHRHVDISGIPDACFTTITSRNVAFHYAHRSDGSQIVSGAGSLMTQDSRLAFEDGYCELPDTTNVLRMWDGMSSSDYVDANGYWASATGLGELRAILTNNPQLRYSMWSWCGELYEEDWTTARTQQYLDAMSQLEADFPNVTFIYMTSHAREEWMGAQRAQHNQHIRNYCAQHGKILYDFEDIETWWNGQQNLVQMDGQWVPMRHPHFETADPGWEYSHTTQEGCEVKARVFWWMMAKLEGCPL